MFDVLSQFGVALVIIHFERWDSLYKSSGHGFPPVWKWMDFHCQTSFPWCLECLTSNRSNITWSLSRIGPEDVDTFGIPKSRSVFPGVSGSKFDHISRIMNPSKDLFTSDWNEIRIPKFETTVSELIPWSLDTVEAVCNTDGFGTLLFPVRGEKAPNISLHNTKRGSQGSTYVLFHPFSMCVLIYVYIYIYIYT